MVEISGGKKNFYGFISTDRKNAVKVHFRRSVAYSGCAVGDKVQFVASPCDKGSRALYVRPLDFVPMQTVLSPTVAPVAVVSTRRVEHQSERIICAPYESIVKRFGTAARRDAGRE